jgi:hypothetical protein
VIELDYCWYIPVRPAGLRAGRDVNVVALRATGRSAFMTVAILLYFKNWDPCALRCKEERVSGLNMQEER